MDVAVYGLGEIGRLVVRALLLRGLRVTGAVDVNEEIIGRDAGEVSGAERIGSKVYGSYGDLLRQAGRPDVVVHATGSFLDITANQILEAVESGAHVVSTCETLAYPWYRFSHEASIIDEAARRRGVVVLGSGVNPGFVLDALPALASLASFKLEKLVARRSLNASKRRSKFREKIGLGLRREEFEKLAGKLTGHVGYAESALLISQILGLRVSGVVEDQRPVIENGVVKGVAGYAAVRDEKGVERVRVEFSAVEDAEDFDEIVLEGEPRIVWRSSGVHGDYATAAVVSNLVPRLPSLGAGLKTMADVVRGGYWWG